MIKLVFTGIKRRKHETKYVSIVTFATVLFLCGITLFQNISNNYVMQKNFNAYGNWIVSTVNKKLDHPYFKLESSCMVGTSLIDGETLVENQIVVGAAADNFDLIDGSKLYEGRMPKNENEIVMDTISLATLGYSYDLGQTISVYYRNAEGRITEKEYELVGTMKCFAQIWKVNQGYTLPNCFVSVKEFEKNYKQSSYITYFYQLNPEYSEISAKDFGNQFVDKDENNTTIFNSYVYENQLWGTSEIYWNVTFALMAISAMAISYLMIAYTGKRRNVFYKYRCIGASGSQVRRIILVECAYATVPEIVLGIGSSYIIVYGLCRLAGRFQGITDVYTFDGTLLVGQILATFGVVLLAALATQFSISDKRLAGNTEAVKPSKYKKLRKIARRTKKPEKTIFKRQNALRPIQNLASILFSIMVCAILVFCVNKILDSYESTRFVLRVQKDVEMETSVEHFFEVTDSNSDEKRGMTNYDMYTGADNRVMEQIKMCPGVDRVDCVIQDGLHYFTWDGMEESQLMKNLIEAQECGTPLEYGMEMVFYENLSDVKTQVEAWGSPQNIDWDKFIAGEQVILIVDAYDLETGEKIEETLQLGDQITIRNSFTDVSNVSVEIAMISDQKGQEQWAEFMTGSYKIIGSMALAEKIASSDGQELRYNKLWITYDQNASYESSDKQLARLAKDCGLNYSSQAELRRIYTQQLIQTFVFYGIVFLVIATIYIVIQRSFLVSKNKYWQARFILLKQIGMEDSQYFRLAFLEECRSYLWILVGLIPGFFVSAWSLYTLWGTPAGNEVTFMENIWYYMVNKIDHGIYIVVALLLYLAVVAGSAYVIRKCIQTNRREEGK